MFNILYVDDDPALLEMGKQYLERSGQFRIDTIESALRALTLLKSKTYDSIVADYQMPGMDGIEFLKKIRTSGNTIPFILFTGRGREEIVIQALNEGANFYLQKGGDPKALFAELTHKIQIAVEHHRDSEKLQALHRLYSVISATNKAIVHLRTRDEFFSEIFRILVETGGFRMVWIGLVDEEHKIILPVASAGYVNGYLDTVNISTENIPRGRGAIGTAYREGRNYICNDISRDPRMELWHEDALKRGYQGIAAFPFALGTKNVGVLALYAPVTGFFDEQIVNLLDELARDISFALRTIDDQNERAAAESALQESEEKFRGIFDFINDGIEIHEFLSDGTLGKYIEVNDVACKMVQYTRKELLQRAPSDITTAYHSRPIGEILNELSRTGHAIFETEHRKKDGTIFPVEINAHVSYLQGKRVAISVVRDISERIRTAHELSQKNLNLSIINELEREFSALPYGKQVEELAIKRLLSLTGAVVTVFSKYYPGEQVLRTTAIEFGPGVLESLPGAWEKCTALLGSKPGEFQIPLSREAYQDVNRSIVGKKNTLTDISYGKITPLVSATIQKLSGIDRFFHIAHVIDGKVYGTSVIGLRPDRPDPPQDLMESYAHLVAVSLRRQQAEAALRESEKFNRNLVEHLPDFVLIYGKDGKILYANPASAGALGYDAQKLIGTPVISYVVESYRDKTMENLSLRQNYGTAPNYEIEIVNHNGLKKRVIVRGTPIQYNDVAATLLVLVDVTERSVAEKALKESEQRMSAIFNSARVGIILIDAVSHKILQVNSEALNLIGASEKDVIGVVCHTFICPAEQGTCPAADFGQSGTSSEGTLTRKDGSVLPIIKTVVPVEIGDKKVFIESFVDISKRKHAEDSLRLANKKLSLLTNITRHDINNQLTGLNGFVELLHERINDPALENYFTWITQASNRISSTIQFTKEYSGVGESAPAWQDIRSLVDIVSTQVQLKGVTVINDIPGGIKVFSDPLIIKVFYNLIENAVRYGGKKITTIRIYPRKSEGVLVIFVEDDGDGVPSGEKEKIFDWGFGKNTGLGLALSREILDITGITIQENGERHAGARFEIRIPTGYWAV
ncbi:MAG: PAS domain S-box protein [Methanoregula sp.]